MSSSGPPGNPSSPAETATGEGAIASGETLNPVGRDAELERLDGLLAEVSDGRTGVLLIAGDPGLGKSTLLAAARRRAAGFTCVAARGYESESSLAYAGLLSLLSPLRQFAAELPDLQRAALSAALGWSSSPAAADRFLAGAATLSLLAAAAEQGPLLVVVDDLHWVDEESVAAILFAARRMESDPIAFLLASRPVRRPVDPLSGVPVLRLEGVPASAATDLLPGTAPVVARRLHADTAGSPLAMLEVARVLDDRQRSGKSPIPDPLPGTDRLDGMYGSVLAGLSPEAFAAVLLVALDEATVPLNRAAVAALHIQGRDPGALFEEARVQSVLVHDGAGYRFRHPLLRAAVLHSASPIQRRESHRSLAATYPDGSSASIWHLARAALGPEPALADQLAELADLDRDRLGFSAAASAMERASELTADPDLAARRMAKAAQDAFIGGDVARVHALTGRVLGTPAPDDARGGALFTLGMLEQYGGSVPRAAEHLTSSSALLSGIELDRSLAEQAITCFRLNDFPAVVRCAEQIDANQGAGEPEHDLLANFTGGTALLLTGDVERGAARLAQVGRLAALPELRYDARALVLTALAAGFTGDVAAALDSGAVRVEEVRRRGAVGVLVPTLALMAAGKAWVGDHAGAFADAGEAAELGSALGYAADVSVAVEMLAWQQAARGMHDEAARSIRHARELIERAEVARFAAHHALTSAFCALCRGDPEEVIALLEVRLAEDGGVGSSGEPLGVAPMLVEAYVAVGRTTDAQLLTERYAEATVDAAQPLSIALVQRCRAITVAGAADVEAAIRRAMEAHAAAFDPFEQARTQLLYGSRLRRAGQRVRAREQLSAAHAAFAGMELTHWTTVAAEELAASGAKLRRGDATGDEPLTSQETRVALLTAQGLSNREVAAALFLSPKTIERHLTNIYRKRGLRSRAELAAAYARTDDPPAGT